MKLLKSYYLHRCWKGAQNERIPKTQETIKERRRRRGQKEREKEFKEEEIILLDNYCSSTKEEYRAIILISRMVGPDGLLSVIPGY
jgi:hypothetical protein